MKSYCCLYYSWNKQSYKSSNINRSGSLHFKSSSRSFYHFIISIRNVFLNNFRYLCLFIENAIVLAGQWKVSQKWHCQSEVLTLSLMFCIFKRDYLHKIDFIRNTVLGIICIIHWLANMRRGSMRKAIKVFSMLRGFHK